MRARRECVRHGEVGGDGRRHPLHGTGTARRRRVSESTTATGVPIRCTAADHGDGGQISRGARVQHGDAE